MTHRRGAGRSCAPPKRAFSFLCSIFTAAVAIGRVNDQTDSQGRASFQSLEESVPLTAHTEPLPRTALEPVCEALAGIIRERRIASGLQK